MVGWKQEVIALRELGRQQMLSDALPFVALLLLFAWTAKLQPNALSVAGITLLFSSALPLVLASMSQMFIITLGDIDLGNGNFIGLTNVIAAAYLRQNLPVAIVLFMGAVGVYMAAGALVQIRRIPSIIVTLGASFMWLGIALLILSIPGGSSPDWLSALLNWSPPVIPAPLLYAVVIALIVYIIMFRTNFGTSLRGTGSNPQAVVWAGWSVLRIRVLAYALAALFGIFAGLALTGLTSSGDPNASANYTLLSIAAVILGGGDFSGGRAAPVGAVVGALAISLVASLLTVLNVSSDFQSAVQGIILIVVLAARALTRGLEA